MLGVHCAIALKGQPPLHATSLLYNTYTQSLHAITSSLAVEGVGNLLRGCPSYIVTFWQATDFNNNESSRLTDNVHLECEVETAVNITHYTCVVPRVRWDNVFHCERPPSKANYTNESVRNFSIFGPRYVRFWITCNNQFFFYFNSTTRQQMALSWILNIQYYFI